MRSFAFILILIPIFLLVDLYAYKGLRKVLSSKKPHLSSWFFWLWWSFSIVMAAGVVLFYIKYSKDPGQQDIADQIMKYNGFFVVQFVLKLFYIIFEFLRDVVWLIKKAVGKFRSEKKQTPVSDSRREFIRKVGVVASVIPFVGLIHGIGWGRFNFTLHRKKLFFPNLPMSFNGLRVVQLSDAHLGSLNGHQDKIAEVVEQVNELNPDLIMFTGDMVNNYAHEMSSWVPVWKKLQARIGKFAVLGNHDYGNYSEWPSPQAKKRNLQDIIRQEKEMGFTMLLNNHHRISRNGESIVVGGVENWGSPPFPQFGDIDKALEGVDQKDFTILLSHDPDHWEQKIIPDKRADITLSGHTHGFQMGIEIGNFKISPVQLRYKQWAGLYQRDNQYIYVNRGLGYLAFPGRVGIWPEITLLEIYRG